MKLNPISSIKNLLKLKKATQNMVEVVELGDQLSTLTGIKNDGKIKEFFKRIWTRIKKYQEQLEILSKLYIELDELWDIAVKEVLNSIENMPIENKEKYKQYVLIFDKYGELLEELCKKYVEFDRIVDILENKIIENYAEKKSAELKSNK